MNETILRPCIYCGTLTPEGDQGEHVVPEAIGGALTLNHVSKNWVCKPCNSGPLSRVDRELCSRSYMSVVASQEIRAPLWQIWNVDHDADNLLIESKPLWEDGELKSLVTCPQMIFERKGFHIRGDGPEMLEMGMTNYSYFLTRAIYRAFQRYQSGMRRDSIFFEKVETGVIYKGYRLAPRVFTTKSIFQLARKWNWLGFKLRYKDDADKKFALWMLSRLREDQDFDKYHETLGSHFPTNSFTFDLGDAVTGLMKMGVNRACLALSR